MSDRLEEEKKRIITWLESLENPSILREVSLVMEDSAMYTRTLSSEELASIERGLKQAEAGVSISREEARKRYAKYL